MKNLKHIFSFKGRAGRLEYFIHSFADVALILVFAWGQSFTDGENYNRASEILDQINEILFFVIIFGGMIAGICVTVRRFHDLGHSGGHFFLTWIPLYNIYLFFKLLFAEGEPVTNDYGHPPN